MRSKLEIILMLVSLLLIVNCEAILKNDEESNKPENLYDYTGYDSTGHKIVEGWITMNFQEESRITGEWKLEKTGESEKGNQFGKGNLEGSYDTTHVWINLNPGIIDDNVYLNGELKNGTYQGSWFWGTFAGVSNHGTFKAVKD